MSERLVKHVIFSPTMLMALMAMLWPNIGQAALPPAEDNTVQKRDAESTENSLATSETNADSQTAPGNTWAIPPVRFGGSVSYDLRRDSSDGQSSTQSGLNTTLNASTQTFLWQPWFAQLSGNVGLTMSRITSHSNSNATDISNTNSSKNVFLTGGGQLSILPVSRFPFEAHFERSDSRVSNELAIGNGYASQRFGFTQHYTRQQGDSMIGWDRNTQTSARNGRDQQDTWVLNASQNMDKQHMQLTGNRSLNKHENTGESAVQNNVTLQHSYTPNPSFSVESMGNLSQSGYHLVQADNQQGDNKTRITQLSSLAFWRPDDQPLTVTGGARLFTLASETNNGASVGNISTRNANFNLGVNYELSKFTRLNAGANVNLITTNGLTSNNTNQTIGASYQPDFIEWGNFRYNWSTSGSFVNSTGTDDSSRQLTLQLSHGLSRSYTLSPSSNVSMDVTQSITALTSSGTSNQSFSSDGSLTNNAGSTQRLTHSGSLSWSLSKEPGDAMLRLSASDSRTIGGKQDYFQFINLQASSNLPTGDYSSWTGNLTIQAVRQSATIIGNTSVLGISEQNANEQHGFVTTSSGSVTYQHQRVFGMRRLRFVSDLRLNSQALLPLLGGPQDQETAGWENRLDYSIGRTQLRLNVLVSRTSVPRVGTGTVEKSSRMNKSIMLSAIRTF
ncbi:MAG: hypothetical protein ABIQ90_09560 [Polaromonas sp.]